MSKYDKLINGILDGKKISYKDAEKILFKLGFELSITGSHHIFRKSGYQRSISLKKRTELLNYQVKIIQEVLKDHNYAK
ncbi:MAG TPA: type II toxin-antitoxin system HicA family toxin [Candidatus Babeliales bacterium]|nr:type II toxin-antitoxin system HicA family toxin [Candidatus Babeliales bacterium]